jgi:hypothetical protein
MKNQLNILVDDFWIEQLEEIAAKKTLESGEKVKVSDLVKRAISEKYKLSNQIKCISFYDEAEYLSALEKEKGNDEVFIMPWDDPSAFYVGTFCYDEGEVNQRHYRLYLTKRKPKYIDYDSFKEYSEAYDLEVELNSTILIADQPRKLRLGFAVVETGEIHSIPIRDIKNVSEEDIAKYRKGTYKKTVE